MRLKLPKNTEKYEWTKHSLIKMRYYGLTAQRVLRVINNPQRKEDGVVEKTIAVMQPALIKIKNGKKIWSQEIWAMYQPRKEEDSKSQISNSKNPHPALSQFRKGGLGKIHPVKSSLMRGAAMPQFNRVKIISAWRYPGVSPKNNPIPKKILGEINDII